MTPTDRHAPLADAAPPTVPGADLVAIARKPTAPARVLVASVVAGLALDRLPSGAIGVGTTVLVLAVPVLLVVSGAARTPWSWVQLVPIAAIAPWLSVRANVTIRVLDLTACAGLVVLSVTSGPLARRAAASPDRPHHRPAHAAWSMLDGARFAGAGVKQGVLQRHDWTKAVVRGLLLVSPLAGLVVILLATADDSFATVLGAAAPDSIAPHLVLVVVGAVVFAGLARAASTPRLPVAWNAPHLGRIEVVAVLAVFATIFVLFVGARLIDPAGSGDNPFALADDARAGFFQLVAVVVITVLMLGAVRAVAGRGDRVVGWLVLILVALTIVLVGIALHRLDRYRDEFGLTELRLGTTWFSVWLGVVVLVVGASFLVPASGKRFVVAIAVSALVWLVGWNVIDPDQRIAVANLDRAVERGSADSRFDAELIGGLSADAIPAIVDRVDDLAPRHRDAILALVCDGRHADLATGLAANASLSAAHTALERVCRPPDSGG